MLRLNALTYILLTLLLFGCKPKVPEPVIPPEPEKPAPGPEEPPIVNPKFTEIRYNPQQPDSDQPLTITFTANKKHHLAKHDGSLYLHAGVVFGNKWNFVPGEWGQNLPKTEMKQIAPGTWQIVLGPTLRHWFDSFTWGYPFTRLGLVIRTPDGSQKAFEEDVFVKVLDKNITHPQVEYRALPPEIQEGITISPDGSVTFALYDMQKVVGSKYKIAYLRGSFNDWVSSENSVMYRDAERGVWWKTVEGKPAGEEHTFQYQLFTKEDEVIHLADPYSEKVITPSDSEIPYNVYPEPLPYPVEGFGSAVTSFTINEPEFQWQYTDGFQKPEPEDLIIYEIHLRDFTPAGNLLSALGELERLQELGVNAIELMPVQEFDGNDSWGYNPSYYFALDKVYGTKDMYKLFIDECHRRGMAVIFDVVYNHMTAESPLAQLYFDYEKGQTASENPYFNQQAPHPYSVFHDLNHMSRKTRTMIKRNLQFLLTEYRIDGFRFDLSKGFTNTPSTEATASNYNRSRVFFLKQ